MDSKKHTAAYRVISDAGGERYYHFFCDLSGALGCIIGPIRADTEEEELALAWEKGCHQFNRCQKCGRWVCDAMYNADVLECVDCAPWEEAPNYCVKCGAKVSPLDVYCRECGTRLRYGEVWE